MVLLTMVNHFILRYFSNINSKEISYYLFKQNYIKFNLHLLIQVVLQWILYLRPNNLSLVII